jgi:peptidoglycan/LPS O-acetylase OafA/YrhL
VIYARVARRATVLKILLMLAIIAISVKLNHGSLRIMPPFGIGAAMAGDLDRIRGLSGRAKQHPAVVWTLLVIGSLLIVTQSFITAGARLTTFDNDVTLVAVPLGAAILVLLAIVTSPVSALCETRVVQWLGKQSFSLYLVHEPILVSVALVLGSNTPVGLILLIALPLALAASVLFQRVIEGPAHRLSQKVGREINARVGDRRQVAPSPVT